MKLLDVQILYSGAFKPGTRQPLPLCVHQYACVCVRLCVCASVCVFVCVCMCLYVCVHPRP